MSASPTKGSPPGVPALVADALVDALGAPGWAGRRVVFTGIHGVDPAELFNALLPRASETVEMLTGREASVRVAAVPLPRGNPLIPYLVAEPGQPSSDNSGDPGFAATLRTQFLAGDDEASRVLLVLAARPDETVTTASDDASALDAMSLSRLLDRAAMLELGALPSSSSLLRAVLRDLGGRDIGSTVRARLEAFLALIREHGASSDSVIGDNLWRLGDYLRDPAASPRRLRDGRKWRAEIEHALANPSRSLERHLIAKRVTRVGAAKVAAAAGPAGMNWAAFELADLQREGDREPVTLVAGNPIVGASLVQFGASGAVIAWMPAGGGSADLNLSRGLEVGEGVRLRWSGTRAVPAAVTGQVATVALVPASPGAPWRFGWLSLPDGSGGFGEPMPLAVTFSDAVTVAFEDDLNPDPAVEAFICGEQPHLRAWTAAGRDLGLATLAEAGGEDPDKVQQVIGQAPDGTTVGPVPVLATGGGTADSDGDGPDRLDVPGGPDLPTSGPDGEPPEDIAEPADADDSWLDTVPEPAIIDDPTERLTLPHALLAKGIVEWPEQAGVNEDGELSALIASSRVRIRPRLGSQDLLPMERATHGFPEWAQYRIDASGAASKLAGLPEPEASWEAEMGSFRIARTRFFAAAKAAGSAYAINPLGEEAVEYVESYQSLLWALPRRGMHRSEYDLLVAIDAIELHGVRDLLISPLSPITVAYHGALARRLQAATDGSNPLAVGDLGAFTLQWVVPLVNHRDSWFESIPLERAMLWRRYELLDDAAQGSHGRNSHFIANRIAFFLGVHPSLAGPDNRLAITCASPGDGKPVIDALRRLMGANATQESDYQRPMMDVVLAGPNPEVRETLSELATGVGAEADRIVNTRCNVRIRDEARPDGFSHLTFLFRTPGGRSTGPLELDTRAPTTYAGGLATRLGRVTIPEADPVFATGVFAAEPAEGSTAL
jgi:hypothetical protein